MIRNCLILIRIISKTSLYWLTCHIRIIYQMDNEQNLWHFEMVLRKSDLQFWTLRKTFRNSGRSCVTFRRVSRWWVGIFVPSGTHGPRPWSWEPRSENTVATRQDVDKLCEDRVCATHILNSVTLTVQRHFLCKVHILCHQYLFSLSNKKTEFKCRFHYI